MDRGLVIELLRNPPPKLLLMSDSLPDEAPSKPQVEEIEPSPVVDEVDATETKPQMDIPIHVMSAEWSTQKRLKKVQLETLERIYLRSKRPTVSNIYMSSIFFSLTQVYSLFFCYCLHFLLILRNDQLRWCCIYHRIQWSAA